MNLVCVFSHNWKTLEKVPHLAQSPERMKRWRSFVKESSYPIFSYINILDSRITLILDNYSKVILVKSGETWKILTFIPNVKKKLNDEILWEFPIVYIGKPSEDLVREVGELYD